MTISWAKRRESAPHFFSEPAKGIQKDGIRYERAVWRHLAGSERGVWWDYVRDGELRFCQTDLLLPLGERLLVIEVKLTYRKDTWEKVSGLYVPVVEKATDREVIGVIAVRSLRAGYIGACGELDEAVGKAMKGEEAVWHWVPRPRFARASHFPHISP